MFSRRFPAEWTANRLSQALAAERAAGRAPLDLTESNPTRAGFEYPDDLLEPLGDPRGLTYAPEPLGLREAREAVAADYARRGVAVPAGSILLTSSTSEAYSLLFKVLCDPGDEVFTPRPSYPLFEHLAALDGVVCRPYDLEYHGAWSIDLGGLEGSVSARTRAVLLVSPNNPTGSFVKPNELDQIAELCRQRGAAIIADEVFADYEIAPGAARAAARVLARRDVLSFSLGGLSKSVGLPQVKLGWIAAAGPEADVRSAFARLEFAADTYLSVSTPVQCAAGTLLERGSAVRRQIQARVMSNYRQLIELASRDRSCRVLPTEGGWYASLQVPSLGSEEDLVLELLTGSGVLVHPGYFFDFPRESYLILSLLPPVETFREGVSRIFAHVDGRMNQS
jgi:hypothetical protein